MWLTIKNLLSKSPEDTIAIGKQLAKQLKSGDVLLLCGDMGAGKSELARGIALGLGVEEPITSPTFTLLNIHQTSGKVALHHFDWYRAADAEELLAAGLEEYITGECIAVIEWHERAPELIPAIHLQINIQQTGETERNLQFFRQGGFRELYIPGIIHDVQTSPKHYEKGESTC